MPLASIILIFSHQEPVHVQEELELAALQVARIAVSHTSLILIRQLAISYFLIYAKAIIR